MSRTYTNKLLQLIQDESVDKDAVIQACLDYMSEDDVKDMMMANDFGTVDEVGDVDYNEFDDDSFDEDDNDHDNY
jgi:hypothetical protein